MYYSYRNKPYNYKQTNKITLDIITVIKRKFLNTL